MYRWAPVNRTRVRTEPAPSELLKVTGMQPNTRRAEPATTQNRRGHGDRQGVARVLCSFQNGWMQDQTQPRPSPFLLQPGQILARGVCRHLAELNFAALEEYVPERGRRVDVMAMGPKGELWVVECKSSRADFMADSKWQGYLDWADRFFWAVDADFPVDILPGGTGLILADSYGAEIIRMGPMTKLAGARRSAVTRKFARDAARRLLSWRDPQV